MLSVHLKFENVELQRKLSCCAFSSIVVAGRLYRLIVDRLFSRASKTISIIINVSGGMLQLHSLSCHPATTQGRIYNHIIHTNDSCTHKPIRLWYLPFGIAVDEHIGSYWSLQYNHSETLIVAHNPITHNWSAKPSIV